MKHRIRIFGSYVGSGIGSGGTLEDGKLVVVGAGLGGGECVCGLNCRENTFMDFDSFGSLLNCLVGYERKIRMFYVDLIDVGVRNRELINYFDRNIGVLVSHLHMSHDCSDSFHKPTHYNYVCEHLFMN